MRRVVITILAVFLVLAGVAGYLVVSSQGSTQTQVIKDQKVIPKWTTAFVRNPYKDDYDLSRIAGYIDNRSGSKVVRAHLEIQLTDVNGNRKELVKYDISDIPAYSRKSFDANAGDLPGSRNATAKITWIEVVK